MVLTVVVGTLKEIECGVRSAQWAYGPHCRTVVVPLIATHECEIEWNNFSCKDAGIWTCQMNGYEGKFYGLKKLNVTCINHCT